MKITRGEKTANKGIKLSKASQTELCLCSAAAAQSSGRCWRCLRTAQGIVGRRPRRSLTEGERGVCAGGKQFSVSESQLSMNISSWNGLSSLVGLWLLLVVCRLRGDLSERGQWSTTTYWVKLCVGLSGKLVMWLLLCSSISNHVLVPGS